MKLGDRKTSIFAKLFEFDDFFNICWFWVDLCTNFCIPQNVQIFTKKWENYCKMGLNKRSYNFTQKQRWIKNSEIENIDFMWSGKKKFVFFWCVGISAPMVIFRPFIFWLKFEKMAHNRNSIKNFFHHYISSKLFLMSF